MKEVLDFFMVVGFVLFLVYVLRGFILQVQENDEKRKNG